MGYRRPDCSVADFLVWLLLVAPDVFRLLELLELTAFRDWLEELLEGAALGAACGLEVVRFETVPEERCVAGFGCVPGVLFTVRLVEAGVDCR